MANKASAENVQADMQPPNYRAAVQRIRTIPAKRDKISSVNGEIADIYAKVEGHKVNRKGAKLFYALDRMEAGERNDVLRSLNGLCDAAGWDEEDEDLVDKAEGTVVPLRVGSRAVANQDDADAALDEAIADEAAGDDGGFTESTEEELAAQEGRADAAAKRTKAKEVAQPAPGTGAAAIKAMKEQGAPVPYTGDNSDLAGAEPKGTA